jgi:hypothetical protein
LIEHNIAILHPQQRSKPNRIEILRGRSNRTEPTIILHESNRTDLEFFESGSNRVEFKILLSNQIESELNFLRTFRSLIFIHAENKVNTVNLEDVRCEFCLLHNKKHTFRSERRTRITEKKKNKKGIKRDDVTHATD